MRERGGAVVGAAVLLILLGLIGVPAGWAQAPGTFEVIAGSRFDQSAAICGKPGAPAPPACLPSDPPNGSQAGISGYFAYSAMAADNVNGRMLFIRTGGHADMGISAQFGYKIGAGWQVYLGTGFRADGSTYGYPKYSTNNLPCDVDGNGVTILPFQPTGCREPAAVNTYVTGEPTAIHTYRNPVYMESVDAVLSAGGLRWWDGNPANQTWWGKITADVGAWINKNTQARPGGYSGTSVWDRTRNKAWARMSSVFVSYDPALPAGWTTHKTAGLQNCSDHSQASQLAINDAGTAVYHFCRGSLNLRVNNPAAPAAPEVVVPVTGDTAFLSGPQAVSGAAMVWEQALYGGLGGLVVLGKNAAGTASALYTVDVSTNPAVATRQDPPTGPSPAVCNSNICGGLLKWQGKVYVFTGATTEVMAYTPAWGSAPPPTFTLTVMAAGSGVCTPGGGGTFPQNTSVTPSCVPDPGSSAPLWTPPSCGQAFPLTADTTCTATSADVQAPVVTISSPTAGQLVKAIVPITFAATDNRPGGFSTVMKLDGVVVDLTQIDPATIPEGAHVLEITETDAAGNPGVATVSFTSVQCQCQAQLTIQQSGDGSATLPPGGKYLVGSTVGPVPPPTVDAASEFKGYTPTLCSSAFTMPATGQTCVASVTKKVVAPPSGAITATFSAFPLWGTGKGPCAGGCKHARLAFDSRGKRVLVTGGDRDGSDAGNPSVWAFTVGGPAVELSPMCPAHPAWMPSFPDNVTWAFDEAANEAVILPGYFNDFARAKTVCQRSQAYADDQILKVRDASGAPVLQANGLPLKEGGVFSPATNAWSPGGWPYPSDGYGGDQGSNFGFFDQAKRQVIRFKWSGINALQILTRTTNTWRNLPVRSPLGGVEHTRVANTYATTSEPAFDPVKRDVYVVAGSTVGVKQPDGTWKDVFEGRLLRVNVDTGIAERIALPAGYVWPNVGDGGTDKLLAFDPIQRVLIHPNISSLCGDLVALYAYDVDARTWATLPIPAQTTPSGAAIPFKGNVFGWDPTSGTALLLGGHHCGTATPNPTHYWAIGITRKAA